MAGFGIALVLAGIIILFAGLAQTVQNKVFANAEIVHGKVINKRQRNLKNTTAYELTVIYTVNGINHSKVIGVKLTEYRSLSEGDSFDLMYCPDNPRKAINPEVLEPKKARSILRVGAVITGIGLALLLLLIG